MEKRHFRYVKFETKEGFGYACVCYTFDRAVGGSLENTVNYIAGVSFCSPKDFFKKDIARLKAQNRFDTNSEFHNRVKSANKHIFGAVSVPALITKHLSHEEFEIVFSDMLTQLDNTDSLPKWAKTAYRTGDFQFGLTEQQVGAAVLQTTVPRPKKLFNSEEA